jgi:oligopeptide/dipeptide ABC transporter ATP-binding protein
VTPHPIADEPTTALDVTIQAQVLELMKGMVERLGASLVLVTHNLGVVARYAKRIYVMYAGRIVESGSCADIFAHPRHPYTVGLMRSVPRLDEQEGTKLVPIPGHDADHVRSLTHCAFLPRCPIASKVLPGAVAGPVAHGRPTLGRLRPGRGEGNGARDYRRRVRDRQGREA